MSAAEMRAELKALRKEHPEHKAVSKMKKREVADLIQKMKMKLEETPPVAALPGAPAKMYEAAVEGVKKAKAAEFPLVMTEEKHHKKSPAKKAPAPKKAPAAKPEIVAKAVKASEKKAVALKETGAAAGAPEPRPAKGSEEMKAKMAAIRAKKGKKE